MWIASGLLLDGAVIALGIAYGLGLLRRKTKARDRPSRWIWQALAFALGWLALAAALLSPLAPLTEISFAAHMAQHVLLLMIAPPLLILGKPLAPLMNALPSPWRRPLGYWFFSPLLRSPLHLLTRMPIAITVHSIAIWLWHAPLTYQAALTNEFIHYLEHLSLFGSALLFWWSIINSGRQGYFRYGSGVVALFLMALHTKLLGVLIALAPDPLYITYATSVSPWGLSALEDQQWAGLIMLLPCGFTYLFTGLILMAAWLTTAERQREPTPQPGITTRHWH
ncbi:cytochrome c oxidase assembly protein [Nitrosococcus wardiae]|uniref:Cytochrome c oxidase assembly protein n=1 Tax=Nitrosococcus wardiae TaxID=1814290 RepID=A0A4P7BZS8_9GAMM|nr:cytochrome c oxidase assembly protein [Nitrosococcus wardiae]QBQ55758.1 cytochrome c oxidase assembly protein [Nitrosococcus wardiae]